MSTATPTTRAAMKIEALNCPSCAAPLADISARKVDHVVCEYCDHVIEVAEQLKPLHKLQQTKPSDSPLSLGDVGTFDGVEQTVIAILRYYCEGERWLEYSLYSPTHGYSFLSYTDGHWTLSRRNRHAWVEDHWAKLGMQTYFADEAYVAKLEYVAGQLTWQAKIGDTSKVREYIAPEAEHKLVQELGSTESEVFVESYVQPAEVGQAFGISVPKPRYRHPLSRFRPSALFMAMATWGFRFFVICCVLVLVLDYRSTQPKESYAITTARAHVLPFTASRVTQLTFNGHVNQFVRGCAIGIYHDELLLEDLGATLKRQKWGVGHRRYTAQITRRLKTLGGQHELRVTGCSVQNPASMTVKVFADAWPTRYIFFLGLVFLAFRLALFFRRLAFNASGA